MSGKQCQRLAHNPRLRAAVFFSLSVVSRSCCIALRQFVLLLLQGSTPNLPQVLDVLPGISLIRPPFVPVNTATSVEVVFDSPTVFQHVLELVGMAGGAEIFRQQLPGAAGEPMRFEIATSEVGVIDFFVQGSDFEGNAAAGLPGHLCVLPELAARDGNRIYDKVIEAASQEGQFFGEYSGVRDKGGVRKRRMESAETQSLGWKERDLQGSLSHDPSSGSKGWSGSGWYYSHPSGEAQSQSRPVMSMNYLTSSWADVFISNLEAQKWAWKENLVQFILELEVVLQSLRPRTGTAHGSSRCAIVGIVEGHALILVLENMLRHLRLFRAWELMAFVLSKVADGGIAVCWGKETLSGELLLASNLKGRYAQQEMELGIEISSSENDFPMRTATSSGFPLHTDDTFVTAHTMESIPTSPDEASRQSADVAEEAAIEEPAMEGRIGKLAVPGLPALTHCDFVGKGVGAGNDNMKTVEERTTSPVGMPSAAGSKASKKPLLLSMWHKMHKRLKPSRHGGQKLNKQQHNPPDLFPVPVGPSRSASGVALEGDSPSAFQEHINVSPSACRAALSPPSPVPENEPTSKAPMLPSEVVKVQRKRFTREDSAKSEGGDRQLRSLKSMFGSLRKAFSKSSKQLMQEEAGA
ncbi:unnamed protein product [Ostreobium quekettii]|uniref:Uncharacterized protein n=1 Tax=Ostreobium quekettii TaxID=121088 RepID=A0A8S1J4Q6_9CHLO|nr:unnamed protein product [Ostreobium quekettii]